MIPSEAATPDQVCASRSVVSGSDRAGDGVVIVLMGRA